MLVDEPFIYSYIVTGDFNLSTLKLPFSYVNNGDAWCNNDDDNNNESSLAAIIGAALVYFALFFTPIVSFCLIAFIFYLCLVVCFEYKLKSKKNK